MPLAFLRPCCLYLLLALLLLPAERTSAQESAKDKVVNVYSYRARFLIEPLFEAFTAKSGIRVRSVSAKEGLLQRLEREGANSPADVLLTRDFTRLIEAKRMKLTSAIEDKDFVGFALASFLHDKAGHWFALTRRARVIYAAKDRVAEDAIRSYRDLALPQWKGRVCTRSFKHSYNLDLLASVLLHEGKRKTRRWLTRLRDNLARKPQGNDRAQIRAISEGICDVGLGNSYYFGVMASSPEQRAWTENIRIVFPNQQSYGTHINISGMALTAFAPHRRQALRLMSYLLSYDAQRLYTEQNFEYPALDGVPPSRLLEQWGLFKQDTLNPRRIADKRQQALDLVTEVQFDR